MNQPIEVLIAIQARSNSTRFPKKIYQKMGNRRVLDRVIGIATSSANHLNEHSKRARVNCQVAVLHPNNDAELVSSFSNSGAILIGGSETDVLSRYIDAAEMTHADFVVRLTSDCPLMLDFVIAKHVNTAAIYGYDYVNNIDERCRSVADGFDCEILSRSAIEWLKENAKTDYDREHVTTAIRSVMPPSLIKGFVSFKIDTAQALIGTKMSVDTPEDLERMNAYLHAMESKRRIAECLYGVRNIYDL